jgi:hypothetical protein
VADLKRPPPAYQTYASDDLASKWYFQMTLAERGLYDAMLRVQWIDGYVPSDPEELAAVVRRPVKEVHEALSSGRVVERFEESCGDHRCLIHTLLRDQRERQMLRRELQAEGGRHTAASKARQAARQAAKQDGKQPADLAASERAELQRAEASRSGKRVFTTTTTTTSTAGSCGNGHPPRPGPNEPDRDALDGEVMR